jgi:alpha-L-arabinofuranosidase
MTLSIFSIIGFAALVVAAQASELHVAVNGNDAHAGTAVAPFRTIQRAADLAQPGDIITVHAGTYRERITPPRGGESDSKRIVYQAGKGEKVEIKGSEVVRNWTKVQNNIWKVSLPNSFFGTFNPYADLIHGDWFDRKDRDHHTGAVYLNGDWLTEAPDLADVLRTDGAEQLWFGRVGPDNTTIWAQFKGVDPNEQLVEINVRRTVFYPEKPGCNYITVSGFTMQHAATPWAPPTAEQIGLIGTHWSKGWIIENNIISHSVCSGIALGKHGDQFDNTSANTAEGYVKTIERAHAFSIPWTRDNIGHHIVRNNVISHCEQTGIVGSLGAAFSIVTGNDIHDIHVRRLFSGAEMAGIKFHAAIDAVIKGNHIYRTCRGLWLDWMAQGTRVSGNLFHDNLSEDLFMEVDHGPYLIDNNIFLSRVNLLDMSQGGAFAHNLMAGKIITMPEKGRETPYHPAHSTVVAGLKNILGGENRFYNNLFIGDGTSGGEPGKADANHSPRGDGFGLWVYDIGKAPLQTGGNIYYNGAKPYIKETDAVKRTGQNPQLKFEQNKQFTLTLNLGAELQKAATKQVTSTLLGKAAVPGLGYENADASPVIIDSDYFANKRSAGKPVAGPFENVKQGLQSIKVW